MGCLGVHFAITEEQAHALIAATDDEAVMAIIEDIEEETWEEAKEAGLLAETDKAWDAIHRCLTNGRMTWDGGEEPLKWAILGGRRMYDGDEYIVTLIDPQQVQAVAEALKDIDEAELRSRYDYMADDYWVEKNDEDFEYTWHWFQNAKQFFQTAAKAGRYVVFTAEQ
ncbi:MAG: YfbM family protein [Planctomycetes bacterium]|nr:YfbM family protein [Planctomycetota bacterium]